MTAKKEVSIEDLKKEYDSALRTSIEKQIKDLDDIVAEAIEKSASEIILNAIGMTQHWGQWEVDHCNGRLSTLANSLGEKARKQAEEMASSVANSFKADPSIIKALKKEFSEQYYSSARNSVKELAHERALKDVEGWKDTLFLDKKED